MPPPAWKFAKCFGIRHRTVDYVNEPQAAPAFAKVLPRDSYEFFPDGRSFELAVVSLQHTKIGGAPMWYQLDDPEIPAAPWRFLCSLAYIGPSFDSPYPWANWPTPLGLKEVNWAAGDQVLYWFDGSVLYFFINDQGEVAWHLQLT